MFCPKCKNEIDELVATCNICGEKLVRGEIEWVVLGHIEDKISSDFAREIMKSYKIPAVVISKSGFFGDAGLSFGAFFSSKSMLYEVMVPEPYMIEAKEVMEMTLGERWQPAQSKDENN